MFDFDFGDLWDESIEAELLGAWVYIGAKGRTEYRISRSEDQRLVFEGPDARGGRLSGTLQPQGPWLQAELCGEDGGASGIIRLCFAEERRAVLSNFRRSPEAPWGKDIVAHRVPPPAEPPPPPPAPEGDKRAEDWHQRAEAERNPWEPFSHWKDALCMAEVHPVSGKDALRSHWAVEASKLSLATFGLNVVAGAGPAIMSGEMEAACLAQGSTFIGFALFGPLEKKPAMEVHYLAVRDPFQRNGCGAMLLGYVRERCRATGVRYIFATCRWHYISYYLKLGFHFGQDPGNLYSREAMGTLHHVRFEVLRQFKRPVLVPKVANGACRRCGKEAPDAKAKAAYGVRDQDRQSEGWLDQDSWCWSCHQDLNRSLGSIVRTEPG